jgi:hypothetical protein
MLILPAPVQDQLRTGKIHFPVDLAWTPAWQPQIFLSQSFNLGLMAASDIFEPSVGSCD